jgi:hypothetical protein
MSEKSGVLKMAERSGQWRFVANAGDCGDAGACFNVGAICRPPRKRCNGRIQISVLSARLDLAGCLEL